MSGLCYWLGFYELLMAARLHPLTWRIWLLLFVSAHSHCTACNRGQSDRGDHSFSTRDLKPLRATEKSRKDVVSTVRVWTFFCRRRPPQLRVCFSRKHGWKKLKRTAPPWLAPRRCASYANTVSHYSKGADREGIFFALFSAEPRENNHIWGSVLTPSLFFSCFLIFSIFLNTNFSALFLPPWQALNALQWLANGESPTYHCR